MKIAFSQPSRQKHLELLLRVSLDRHCAIADLLADKTLQIPDKLGAQLASRRLDTLIRTSA